MNNELETLKNIQTRFERINETVDKINQLKTTLRKQLNNLDKDSFDGYHEVKNLIIDIQKVDQPNEKEFIHISDNFHCTEKGNYHLYIAPVDEGIMDFESTLLYVQTENKKQNNPNNTEIDLPTSEELEFMFYQERLSELDLLKKVYWIRSSKFHPSLNFNWIMCFENGSSIKSELIEIDFSAHVRLVKRVKDDRSQY